MSPVLFGMCTETVLFSKQWLPMVTQANKLLCAVQSIVYNCIRLG